NGYVHFMENIKSVDYKVAGAVGVAQRDALEDFGKSKKELKKELKEVRKNLSEFQDTLYAHGRYGILVCLQGMDTSGKDSLIREGVKECNVRGVVVYSFKVPASRELGHGYLWRHCIALPERGYF